MNLFSPLLRLFGLGAISNNDEGYQTGTASGTSTDAGISVSDERALQVSSVWACVQYIVNSVCSLPLGLYEKTADGRQELKGHYLNDLLHTSPNALMKPRDFRKAMTTQMVMWSNAYAEIFWNEAGTRPLAIVPLRPGRMMPVLSKGELTYHYQVDSGGSTGVRIYSPKSIMHLKGFGTDGIVGLERSDYARKTVGISVSADVYASKQFANDGNTGGGFLMFDTFLTPEQREQARKLYGNMNETAFNKGRLTILEGGVKYENPAFNPDTLQMIQTRNMQVSEIARFYGVPEVLIGGGGATSAWPASFEQQLLSFLTFTLQDYLDEWESGIRYSLLVGRDRERYFADHDVTGFIKMDSTTKAELQSKWVQNGLKTRNEIRKLNNDPPMDGGDELTIQVNLAPIGEMPDQDEPVEMADSTVMELKHRIDQLERKPEKHEPQPIVMKLDIQPAAAPTVNVNADIQMPRQGKPIVKIEPPQITVEKQDAPIVNVSAPDVTVVNQVETPEVNITNNVEVPEGDKKVTFNRDRDGNITDATLEDG